jgi:DNA-binding transcriptional LysR family regulator
MNFIHLMAFFEVARAGSVSRGAEKLCVSQPVVTREIKNLEARLGVTLFSRHSRGVILTTAGSVLFHYAEMIFGLALDAQREIRQFEKKDDSAIRIGASENIAAYLMPSIIHHFQRKFPNVDVEVVLSDSSVIAMSVRQHELSFGIVEDKFDQGDLNTKVLGTDAIVAVTTLDHPSLYQQVSARGLIDRMLLLTKPDSGLSNAVNAAFANIGLKINPRFCMNSHEGIKRLLLMQGGIAYLPFMCVEEEVKSNKLAVLDVSDLAIQRQIRLIQPASTTPCSHVIFFCEMARRILEGHQPMKASVRASDRACLLMNGMEQEESNLALSG